VDPSHELKNVESLTLEPSGFTLRPRVRLAAAVERFAPVQDRR
jgi:hypothetical protein